MNGSQLSETGVIEENAYHEEEALNNVSGSIGGRWSRLFWHFTTRQFMLLCVIAVKISGLFGRRRRKLPPGKSCEIMLTGRFESDNWILAHLGPLAASKKCSRIWMVSTNPVPQLEKVEAIYPPKWLIKSIGMTQSRLLVFLLSAIWKRPHIVGGFHLMPNGIGAAIAGRLIRARTIYFSVGGPLEIDNGGVHSETRFLRKMETPDGVVEKRLVEIASRFDTIVTMGAKTIEFLRKKGVGADCQVLSGGIDPAKFATSNKKPSVDVIVTCRLAEIKRIDVFLQAVKLVIAKIPDVKAMIVGDGEMITELKQMAFDLGVSDNVEFTGHQNNIEHQLQKGRIFVLTSDSEGLSLSMMEAMMCGLPVIVSDVGDLRDLVENGINGFLVPRRSPGKFASRIIELLTDENKLKSFSAAAHNAALRYSMQAATEKWDELIEKYRTI